MSNVQLNFEQIITLIRHAITQGRAESALPLIDDVLKGLAESKENKPLDTESGD